MNVKETGFFDVRFHKGWGWYESEFRHSSPDQLCAEIAATYFDVPQAAERIYQHNPDCRVIITLRDPVERCFSLYLHHRKKGRLDCDFRAAIARMPRIVESSRYRVHVNRWIEVFGAQRVLVLLLDDIASAPDQVLQRTYDFVGVEKLPPPAIAREAINVASLPASRGIARLATYGADWLRETGWHRPVELAKKLGFKKVYSGSEGRLPTLDLETRRLLLREFAPDIAYVEQLIQRSLPQWRREATRPRATRTDDR